VAILYEKPMSDTAIGNDSPFKHKPTYRTRLGDWLHVGGHAYRQAASRFLQELARYRECIVKSQVAPSIRRNWLLAFREDFRRMRGDETVTALRDFLRYGDPTLRHIAIWLLSQTADRFRLRGISAFCDDPSPQVRKHVAKALRRLEAWKLLEDIARANRDSRPIQWFAHAPLIHRPFRERLEHFVTTVDDSHVNEVVTPSRMPFWALDRAWEHSPPKSQFMIRRILRRIRHWVRWGTRPAEY
jgi:hypothetical protein